MADYNINISDIIIPKYDEVLRDVLEHKHTHYVFAGGRGSTKSSFAGINCISVMLKYPDVNVAVFRKVSNTLRNSVYAQILWAISTLGVEELFNIPKTIANPITLKATGQRIMFFGLDEADKIKSVKVPKGYIGITWLNNLLTTINSVKSKKLLSGQL